MTANADRPAEVVSSGQSTVETTTPTLFGVEGDAYVFVAVREDPTLAGDSNWLSQTLRVDPHGGARDEFRADVTERYHVDGRESHIAFEDRFTLTLSVTATGDDLEHRVATVRDRLDRWYRDAYLDGVAADATVESLDAED
ncbi:hypothetical protein [Salinigranum halophilum]|uniref:hypothetical protein n=1 Tax=Salinigranum halophilum TaxID=2565931 RepID=UPI0010A77289|nr:hypothetical protein [Salinigranum halophilum]